MSSVLIPKAAKEDILSSGEKGLSRYREFVKERLLPDSPKSVRDRMKMMKLKTFSTWMAKTRVSVGDKVIKLREEKTAPCPLPCNPAVTPRASNSTACNNWQL